MVGIDHSEVMIRHERRRNAAAVRDERVRLLHAPVEQLPVTRRPFDAALAVNTVGFWPDAVTRLREIGDLLKPGGRIALVSQPRCPGADRSTAAAAAEELAGLLTDAGFQNVHSEALALSPPAVCVLAARGASADGSGGRPQSAEPPARSRTSVVVLVVVDGDLHHRPGRRATRRRVGDGDAPVRHVNVVTSGGESVGEAQPASD